LSRAICVDLVRVGWAPLRQFGLPSGRMPRRAERPVGGIVVSPLGPRRLVLPDVDQQLANPRASGCRRACRCIGPVEVLGAREVFGVRRKQLAAALAALEEGLLHLVEGHGEEARTSSQPGVHILTAGSLGSGRVCSVVATRSERLSRRRSSDRSGGRVRRLKRRAMIEVRSGTPELDRPEASEAKFAGDHATMTLRSGRSRSTVSDPRRRSAVPATERERRGSTCPRTH
jgi:hypothetical protein